MTDEIDRIVKGLSEAQRNMLLASAPDDMTGAEGCGVDLTTGADYAIAKALERKGLGGREGPGGFRYAGMYWNRPLGLEVRARLAANGGG